MYILVQKLDSNRRIQATTPRKPTCIRTAPPSSTRLQRSRTTASERRSRKSLTYKSNSSKERNTSTNRSLSSHKGCGQTVSSENELINNTLTTFSESENVPEENKSESKTMWRSVVTCMPAPKKPISKRSQHALDDIRAMKQQHILQDPIGSNRPVLPNIRLVPKTKFLYKGLAFKEVKKISGITDEYEDISLNSLKRPLVDYSRTEAYMRHEINAARSKQKPRQKLNAQNANDEPMTRSQTVLDIRETRKRIVKGTTATHYPASKRPGRPERNELSGSEVLVPIRNFSSLSNVPISTSVVCPSLPAQHYKAGYTSPMTSQNFDIPSIETNLTVSIVQQPEQRPPTGKSSTISQAMNTSEITLLTKYVKRPRSTARQAPAESVVTYKK
ncbi:unnamed protein product [Adineta ricciae]|uniref:Uncharacterized protein n=1 Tax=Adineta ricciae TaxID=249248 RepID=A0A814A013_ADIRI|nr:unnamed protein product [Adineta ricciae]